MYNHLFTHSSSKRDYSCFQLLFLKTILLHLSSGIQVQEVLRYTQRSGPQMLHFTTMPMASQSDGPNWLPSAVNELPLSYKFTRLSSCIRFSLYPSVFCGHNLNFHNYLYIFFLCCSYSLFCEMPVQVLCSSSHWIADLLYWSVGIIYMVWIFPLPLLFPLFLSFFVSFTLKSSMYWKLIYHTDWGRNPNPLLTQVDNNLLTLLI